MNEAWVARLVCLGLACTECQPVEPFQAKASGPIEVEYLDYGGPAAKLLLSSGRASFDMAWVVPQDDESNIFATTIPRARNDGSSRLAPVIISAALEGRVTEVAVGSSGSEALIVWRQQAPDGTSGIYRAYRSGTRWVVPADESDSLSISASNASRPDVSFCSRGRAVVVWDQDRDGNSIGVLAALLSGPSPDRSPSFEDFLSPDVQFSNEPKVACTPNGEATVAWYQARESTLEVFVSETGHDGEFRPVELPIRSGNAAGEVSVARHASGLRAVAWREEVAPDEANVFVATSEDGRNWETHTSMGFAWLLGTQTFISDDGDVSVVFSAARPSSDAGTYLWRVGQDGPSSLSRLTPETHRGFSPSTATLDGCGRLIVVEVRAGEGRQPWEVVAKVVDARRPDDAEEVRLSTNAPGDLGEPRVATLGGESAVAAWISDGNVRVARLSGLASMSSCP